MGPTSSSRNKISKNSKSVAMVMKKPSKSSNIALVIMVFCMWHLLNHISLHTKSEQNLPCGLGDRPIATAWQPDSGWGSGGIIWDLWCHWWRHCAHDVVGRMALRATSFTRSSERACCSEYAKFWIFQIRQLLREIWPFLLNKWK